MFMVAFVASCAPLSRELNCCTFSVLWRFPRVKVGASARPGGGFCVFAAIRAGFGAEKRVHGLLVYILKLNSTPPGSRKVNIVVRRCKHGRTSHSLHASNVRLRRHRRRRLKSVIGPYKQYNYLSEHFALKVFIDFLRIFLSAGA
ncbi:hypothetical protein TcasGA2_TC015125 [Tribolium castaneum]|uniref:Uncharacterized protein n=1 Tax=Tribolium castaneum TaxID=7070 RepID=D2A5R6_TRICA|nr:hypothetical protein TcasGA2_TC015125 [Tribolium castaneum]